MRRTPPERPQLGATLIELVLAMVLVGIVVAATVYFLYPVRQSVDLTVRAELTDIADNSLQRIGRDVRLALPNSVRVDGSGLFLEFVPVRTAGRYRGESSGAACGAGFDALTFDSPTETCFKTIGSVPDASQIVPGADYLVLNNAGFTQQDVYEGTPSNRVLITASVAETNKHRFEFGARQFERPLHDSPGRRFFVVTTPVTYACDLGAGTLTRYAGYGFQATQPTTFGSGTAALLAQNVAGCVFSYSPNVAPQVGLLTLRLTLSKALSGGEAETVTLYHAVNVRNVP